MGSLIPLKDDNSSTKTSPDEQQQSCHDAPIVSSYNDKIRPLLDAVDRLRQLKIMQEGIQLPTIVVVGDQSSGKSSVLESLAGISLPRGDGICTRVPLIMRLQNHSDPNPQLFLEFNGKTVPTDEDHIADAISLATEEIAGKGKGISNHPLTLVVKKNGVPDLTMVDLPGITRVPVHGQPADIYEQILKIIMEYITPQESIILNILSASVDFTTCESIRMSQRVDKTGQRTLAVVTKVDKSPEGLLEKVTANDVNIGLGYVCVRNRIGDETYEEARALETNLFETHRFLSKMSKSMVGIPVLAQKLVQIQTAIIVKCLPDIVRKIDDKLFVSIEEMNKLPKHLTSVPEAMATFMHIMGSAKESLKKILLQGDFDEYPDVKELHCTARFAEMFNKYSEELQSSKFGGIDKEKFLIDEMQILEEAKTMGLPNFLPRSAFRALLKKTINGVSSIAFSFVDNAWKYIGNSVISVLMKHCNNYPQLSSLIRIAAQNVIAKKKEKSVDWVTEYVEMEKLTDYTCNPEYMVAWKKLMSHENQFMKIINGAILNYSMEIDGYGTVHISHLRIYKKNVNEAFDVKMRLVAYWKIVARRMVDNMALHLLFGIENLVNKEIENEIISELFIVKNGKGLERMLEELPSISEKREQLKKSIKLLKESKDVVANIIEQFETNYDQV